MSKVPKQLEKRFVKPAPGCTVHMEPPSRLYLPEAGEAVPLTKYWNRRIRMHDVIVVADGTKADPAPEPYSQEPAAEVGPPVTTRSTKSKSTKKDEAQK